jgi:hypothetical protein
LCVNPRQVLCCHIEKGKIIKRKPCLVAAIVVKVRKALRIKRSSFEEHRAKTGDRGKHKGYLVPAVDVVVRTALKIAGRGVEIGRKLEWLISGEAYILREIRKDL